MTISFLVRGDKAHVTLQKCFWLNGQLLVPHYVQRGIYVGPGHTDSNVGEVRKRNRDVCFTETQLIEMGATQTSAMLWPRAW